jgi:MFS family permease
MTHDPEVSTPSKQGAVVADQHGTTPQMRRVATASAIGSLIETYDFTIYGTAAALVFPKVFFPALGPVAGTVASFATFGVAFLARPFGSILFGHLGDRLGRKKTLLATLFIMGVATVLIGALPTAAAIGVAAPVLLIILRVFQGIAQGGEWAGAVVFSAEHAPTGRRGLWGVSASSGGSSGITLASATFLAISLGMSDAAFLSWGWRVPFLASIVLIGVGLWIRLRVAESPVFKTELAGRGVSPSPLREMFRDQPRELALATGAAIVVFSLVLLGSSYLVSYGTANMGLTRTAVLATGIVGGLTLTCGDIIGALWSDRVGRRKVLLIASLVAVVWAVVLFPIIDLGSVLAFGVGVVGTMFLAGIATGPLGALLSELFPTKYRYTATGISYNVAGILGGAIPPLVAASITARYGGMVFGVFLAVLCAVSAACVWAIKETRDHDLTDVAVASD